MNKANLFILFIFYLFLFSISTKIKRKKQIIRFHIINLLIKVLAYVQNFQNHSQQSKYMLAKLRIMQNSLWRENSRAWRWLALSFGWQRSETALRLVLLGLQAFSGLRRKRMPAVFFRISFVAVLLMPHQKLPICPGQCIPLEGFEPKLFPSMLFELSADESIAIVLYFYSQNVICSKPCKESPNDSWLSFEFSLFVCILCLASLIWIIYNEIKVILKIWEGEGLMRS